MTSVDPIKMYYVLSKVLVSQYKKLYLVSIEIEYLKMLVLINPVYNCMNKMYICSRFVPGSIDFD